MSDIYFPFIAHNPLTSETVAGTKAEIVIKIFNPRFDSFRRLIFKCKSYKEETAHSYSAEFSDDEMKTDAVKFLFSNMLRRYGFYTFKNTAIF